MQATETFQVGAEQFTVAIDIDLGTERIITGDFAGTVPAGTVGRLRGSIRLLADLHVRGMLVADPTGVDVDGQNLFDIHTHDGGVLNLVGVEKTAWCRWGDTPVGWQVGDRLAVAPMAVGVYAPAAAAMETIWLGSWAATVRPANTADVIQIDGVVAQPEVVNLSQSLVIRNVTRIMMHESGGVPNIHTLKWLKVLGSGVSGQLGFYPVHFHQLGESARGSLVEGVVVESGKNHAFVPHASHGIDFLGCVAYRILESAFWWDPPAPGVTNHTNDANWDGCLALVVKTPTDQRLAAFLLDGGSGNKCNNSVAAAVEGFQNSSGFSWPEIGGGAWEFNNNVAHNCKIEGIFVWQNNQVLNHLIDGFRAFRCGKTGIEHGAYANFYQYRNLVLTSNPIGLLSPSVTFNTVGTPPLFLTFQDVLSSDKLVVGHHNIQSPWPVYYKRCTFPQVQYQETAWDSYSIFEDCGLVPADFLLTQIKPQSKIDIVESGMLVHHWAAGVWT